MTYDGFYRYIFEVNGKYRIIKNAETFLICDTIEEALYERDRLENVNWDWEEYVHMVDTINGYIHIDLPPYSKKYSYITEESEHWMVRGKGKNPKYHGTYSSYDEAEKVARIYNANITYKPVTFAVKKEINGKKKFFGRYKTFEEAENRVLELKLNDWSE